MKNRSKANSEPLASWADQVLGQLPPRRAPATLAPRVMAVIRSGTIERNITIFGPIQWFTIVIGITALGVLVFGSFVAIDTLVGVLPVGAIRLFIQVLAKAAGIGWLKLLSVGTGVWMIVASCLLTGWAFAAVAGTYCWRLVRRHSLSTH